MKKICLISMFIITFIFANACSTKNITDYHDDLFYVTELKVGNVGSNEYKEICLIDDQSYYVVINVEVAKDIFELRKYTFINKYDLEKTEVLNDDYESCGSSYYILRLNESYNRFYTEDGYIIQVQERDVWNPELEIFEEYNNDDILIETYKDGELDINIENFFEEYKHSIRVFPNAYVTIESYTLAIEQYLANKNDSFDMYYKSIARFYDLKSLFIVLDNGDIILVNDNINFRVDDEILIEKNANETMISIFYLEINKDFVV